MKLRLEIPANFMAVMKKPPSRSSAKAQRLASTATDIATSVQKPSETTQSPVCLPQPSSTPSKQTLTDDFLDFSASRGNNLRSIGLTAGCNSVSVPRDGKKLSTTPRNQMRHLPKNWCRKYTYMLRIRGRLMWLVMRS